MRLNIEVTCKEDALIAVDLLNCYLKNFEVDRVVEMLNAIDSLEITSRTLNSLETNGITTIVKLVSYTEAELFAMPHIGKQCIEEIKLALNRKGFGLKD